jgi:ketosteroid isomerase-like protein
VNQANQLRSYIEAWTRHDVAGVLATLTHDCVVTESYGPVYRGHDCVEQWMHKWFGEGGSVDAWRITSEATAGDVLVTEWIFSCTWQGVAHTFEGATIARLRGEKIAYLREYATTAPLYDWTGTWRTPDAG